MIANLRGSARLANRIFFVHASDSCHHQKGRECDCICIKVLMMPKIEATQVYFKSKSRSSKQKIKRKDSL